jgi:hypothetical protein
MAQKAHPSEDAFANDNTTGRRMETPPGNPRVPPGSRMASPRKGRPPTFGHGEMTRVGLERVRVDTETR